jgi:hypothetical protein
MTGVIPQENVERHRKMVATKYSWKPDIDLLPVAQVKEILENAAAEETALKALISIEKLELASLVFIDRLLKNVPNAEIDIPFIKLFHEWMQMRFESVKSGKNAHQTPCLDWINLTDDMKESLIAEIRASGPQGEALCAIGENLEKIVTGRVEALQILLENDLLYRFYREANELKYINMMLSKVRSFNRQFKSTIC